MSRAVHCSTIVEKRPWYVTILSVGWKDRKERNILFNDALNTFYLRLYGVRHMVKNHSDSERGNPLPLHRLLFPISSKGFFLYAPSHRQDNTCGMVHIIYLLLLIGKISPRSGFSGCPISLSHGPSPHTRRQTITTNKMC